MPKASPYLMKRRERPGFVLSFSDPDSGIEFEMPSRQIGKLEQIAAVEHADSLSTQYVTGWGVPGKKGYTPPDPLPPIDGQPVFASSGAFTVACCLCASQTAPVEAERYDPIELVSFMVSDVLMAQMEEAVAKVTGEAQQEEEKPDPLAQAASETASSATASTEAPPTTPASSPSA